MFDSKFNAISRRLRSSFLGAARFWLWGGAFYLALPCGLISLRTVPRIHFSSFQFHHAGSLFWGRMDNDTKDQTVAAGRISPLEIAARHYYFKPMAIFFNALHLRAFQIANMQWHKSVLDIGCSDGEYGVLLEELLGTPKRIIGIDVDEKAIASASDDACRLYENMVVGSAAELPFESESFEMVVINASLVSIDPGLHASMREVHRVLQEGGRFYATVCTGQYEQNYWISRFLRGIGLHGLARVYMRAMNRRMQQAHLFSSADWIKLFEENGFTIVQQFGFLPLRLVPLWSFLAWTPLRIIGVSRLIPCPWLHRKLAALWKRVFRGVYEQTELRYAPRDSGYMLIEAIKAKP